MEHKEKEYERQMAVLQQEILELRRQMDFYEAALDTLPNPVFIRDEQKKSLFLNRRSREFFALQEEDISGIDVMDLPNFPSGERDQYEARIPDPQGGVREILYWIKEFSGEESGGKGVIGEVVDITEEKRLQRELARYIAFQRNMMDKTKETSQMDAGTGLLNRHAFAEQLPALCRDSRKTGKPLCLLMTDIDKFKSINDNFGHLTGDEILKTFAEAMKGCFRSSDRLIRYGGDEFVAILPGAKLEAAIRRAEHFLDTVRKEVLLPDGKPVTISIGVAQLRDGEDQIAFFSRADEALYRAKVAGRNRVAADEL